MMLTFLELTHMVDAKQHDGVGWSLYVFITFFFLLDFFFLKDLHGVFMFSLLSSSSSEKVKMPKRK